MLVRAWKITLFYVHKTHRILEGSFREQIFDTCLKLTFTAVHMKFGLVIELLNPLNPELNPVCYLLALLGAHHFLHVSRIRVKSLTFR